jgi:hypothetical protein
VDWGIPFVIAFIFSDFAARAASLAFAAAMASGSVGAMSTRASPWEVLGGGNSTSILERLLLLCLSVAGRCGEESGVSYAMNDAV